MSRLARLKKNPAGNFKKLCIGGLDLFSLLLLLSAVKILVPHESCVIVCVWKMWLLEKRRGSRRFRCATRPVNQGRNQVQFLMDLPQILFWISRWNQIKSEIKLNLTDICRWGIVSNLNTNEKKRRSGYRHVMKQNKDLRERKAGKKWTQKALATRSGIGHPLSVLLLHFETWNLITALLFLSDNRKKCKRVWTTNNFSCFLLCVII